MNLKPTAIVVVVLGAAITTRAESKAKVCVWVDSESPGTVMAQQAGGSVNSITPEEVAAIQNRAVEVLKTDKSNDVVDPCPKAGDNIELDVVVGRFRGAYVASVSTTIQGGKDGPIHVSSNVVGASSKKALAGDAALSYESVKFRIQTGTVDLK